MAIQLDADPLRYIYLTMFDYFFEIPLCLVLPAGLEIDEFHLQRNVILIILPQNIFNYHTL